MANSIVLDVKVRDACSVIRQKVKKQRQQSGRKHTIRDYPAAVVACGYSKRYDVMVGESKSPKTYSYCQVIKDALTSIAPIGQKVHDNVVGACAEPHAADLVIKRYACGIRELQFSKAYRPRTCQQIKYCWNCKHTFGL